MTYREAVRRTFHVMAQGVFFYIPMLHMFQMYMRYRDYRFNNWPDWDDNVDYVVLDYRGYRLLIGVVCWIIYLIFSVGSHLYAYLPAHKGMISKAEFIENYNELAINYSTDQRLFFGKYQNNVFWYSQRLDESGRSLYGRMDGSEPRCTFIEENGILKEVIVTMETTGDSIDVGDEVVHAAAALLGAQPEAFWKGGLHDIIDTLEPYAEKEFQLTYCGVELICEIENQGYQLDEDSPWPCWKLIEGSEDPKFQMVMTMRVIE